jgi:hypothetical protein
MRKIGFIATLALLLGMGTAFGQDEYIRYQPGANTQTDGALQIAVEEWATPTGTKVTLYGVVHVADEAYYQQVQRDLAEYDAVLYEGVGATKEALSQARKKGSSSGLSSFQRGFGKLLGLQFQMEGLEYTHENLVHADMGREQFQQQTKGQSLNPLDKFMSKEQQKQLEPFIKMAGEFLNMWLESNPDMRNGWKTTLGSQMAGADMTQQLPPQMYQTIVIDRNQIVMDVLAEQLKGHPEKKNIAIFYGAAHNPDFAQRFRKLGFTKSSVRWMTAWDIGNGATIESPTPEQEKKSEEPREKDAPKKKLEKSY